MSDETQAAAPLSGDERDLMTAIQSIARQCSAAFAGHDLMEILPALSMLVAYAVQTRGEAATAEMWGTFQKQTSEAIGKLPAPAIAVFLGCLVLEIDNDEEGRLLAEALRVKKAQAN